MLNARLSTRDLWLLTETLDAVLASGAALPGAMDALVRDASSRRLRRVLRCVAASLRNGQPLSAALRTQPRAFPESLIALVDAGERTNQLPQAMSQLAAHYRAACDARQRLGEALLYPLVLTALLFGVLWIIMWITPSFERMYNDMGMELPSLTLLTFYAGRHASWILLGLAVAFAGAVVGCWLLLRLRFVRWCVEWVLWRSPVAGRLLRSIALRHFCQGTGALLAAGEPLPSSLRHAAATSPSVVFARATNRLAQAADEGGRIADGMSDRRLFPGHFVWLVSTAERRGDLPEALCTLANSYRTASARQLEVLMSFVQPAYLILFLLPFPSMIAFALLAPLVRIMSAIGM